MVKFISLKTGVLLVVGFLCLGGSVALFSMGSGSNTGAACTVETQRLNDLVAQVLALDARILVVETQLSEEGRGAVGDLKALKQKNREVESLVLSLAKRLEHNEKRVDKGVVTTDNIVKVSKQTRHTRTPVLSRSSFHVVKNGDTLYRISKRYNVSEYDLIRVNGLKDKTRIFIGQKLRVTP
ncbi:LysM domain-containing protein [Desulfoluna sp.]|uniref:LysM peptidoglycan-binding domain-containing protein n=1 Tax=Desulfoluna sp. TaxID=2045199 RepID=UPI00260F4042|nr:LysM domain-containing protein [Desulfoluna sp.]